MPDDTVNQDPQIAALLAAVERKESGAHGALVAAVYPELKRLAHFQLAGERRGHTLNTTAIVHEAYMRLASGDSRWRDRGHFFRAAAIVMRHLLVDYARRRRAERRGAGLAPLPFDDDLNPTDDDSLAVLTLDDALRDIARIDPALERIIECRYFAGLSVAESAEALGVSIRTVERDSQRAKAYLLKALEADGT